MLAMNYRGPFRVRADRNRPDPEILHPRDAIVRVTRSCICGSDLHLYHGLVPDTRVGMTFGHEFTGVVVELGSEVTNLRVGDHVLVPFNIACGTCPFCQQELYGNCHESNPEATAVGGIFGYSHTAGGYDGGQAEYVRVPYADIGPTVIPPGMDLDDAALLTDVTPTGYQAAEMGGIQKGDTVVVFGAGPIGLMAARCSWLFGAGRVIIIDHLDYRLEFAKQYAQCEAYNFVKDMDDPVLFIKKTTDYFGADVCIDAVGCEAAGSTLQTITGRKLMLQAGSATALQWAINSVKKIRDWYAWTLDLPGSYYLQVVEHLFKDNRLATRRFVALGRTIDLSVVRCPLFLLAARDDDVVGREQMFAIEHLVDGKLCTVEKTVAPCGHLGLFMGRDILADVWPGVARWLSR